MRISLCISGQPRNLEKNIPNIIHNLIEPNNITDIFIHTWYHSSMDNLPFDSAQPNLDNRLGCFLPNTDKILTEQLNPIRLICDKSKNFDELSHLKDLPTAIQKRLASNFYSVWRCNELKREHEIVNNFKYDIVIKTRIDLLYHEKVLIKNIINDEMKNSVFTPRIYQEMRQYDSYPIKNGGSYSSLSDTFAFGDSESIDKFCSVYPDFEKIYNDIFPYVYGEAYLGYQSRYIHGLNIKMSEINYIISR